MAAIVEQDFKIANESHKKKELNTLHRLKDKLDAYENANKILREKLNHDRLSILRFNL